MTEHSHAYFFPFRAAMYLGRGMYVWLTPGGLQQAVTEHIEYYPTLEQQYEAQQKCL